MQHGVVLGTVYISYNFTTESICNACTLDTIHPQALLKEETLQVSSPLLEKKHYIYIHIYIYI